MTEDEYDKLVAQLKEQIQPRKYCALRTIAELKKIGMKYFVEDPYGGLRWDKKLQYEVSDILYTIKKLLTNLQKMHKLKNKSEKNKPMSESK